MTRNKTLRTLGLYPAGFSRSASGAVASFRADKAAPLRSLTIGIEPVQSGSGDPSPNNVRPISGWTGANVYQSAALPDLSAWDVLGYDEDMFVVNPEDHVVSVQSKAVLTRLPFDPPQFLFAVTAAACAAFGWSSSGMPAGKYKVTLNHGGYNDSTNQDATYVFTTTQIVPPGGGVRHGVMGENNKTKADVLAGKFTTYGADTTTIVETDIACTEYDVETDTDAVNLGTTSGHSPSYKEGEYINYTERQKYGSNRWSTSWIRQYLNSDNATITWTPKTIWSRNIFGEMPEGFLHTLDLELRAVIGKVRKRYALSVSDGSGYEDVEDFCCLLTYTDLTGDNNDNVDEGPVDASGNVTRTGGYTFWKSRTSDADRIKYEGSTARNWRIASEYSPYGCMVRTALASGIINRSYASNSYGIVPSLFIRLSSLINVSWQSEVGTVYGGTLDVTTGVLTVTDVEYSISGGVLYYGTYGVDSAPLYYFEVPDYSTLPIKQMATRNSTGRLISNYFTKNSTETLGGMKNNELRTQSRIPPPYIYFRWDAAANVTAIDAAFAQTPLVVVAQLATPITYQLTPTQVETLLGRNNVWADCGPIVNLEHLVGGVGSRSWMLAMLLRQRGGKP